MNFDSDETSEKLIFIEYFYSFSIENTYIKRQNSIYNSRLPAYELLRLITGLFLENMLKITAIIP